MRNPILIGKAEEIDEVHPAVRQMLDRDGVYICGDTSAPNVTVPLAVVGGRVYSLKIDGELDPARFCPTLTIHGPYRHDDAAAKPINPAQDAEARG